VSPRSAALYALALCLVAVLAGPARAAAPTPRASLTSIESEVMCVTCGVPLNIAESPQADHERAFIRDQIAQGRTAAQIKQALVAQLGPGVLALPARSGFNLAVYIVPLVLILALAAALAVALPRWRRRGSRGDGPDGPVLTPTEDARLDAELARFDR
jgi:cytochrome c-type biogenesis protein CcmH